MSDMLNSCVNSIRWDQAGRIDQFTICSTTLYKQINVHMYIEYIETPINKKPIMKIMVENSNTQRFVNGFQLDTSMKKAFIEKLFKIQKYRDMHLLKFDIHLK